MIEFPGVLTREDLRMNRFDRFVGLLLIGLAVLGAILMGLAAALTIQNPLPATDTSSATVLGFWDLLYNTAAPPVGVIVSAAGLGLLLAAVVAGQQRP
jgi:hypothetical protein